MTTIPYPLSKWLDKLLESMPLKSRISASLGIFLLLTSGYWTAWFRIQFLEEEISSIILLLLITIIILIAIISYNITLKNRVNKVQVEQNKSPQLTFRFGILWNDKHNPFCPHQDCQKQLINYHPDTNRIKCQNCNRHICIINDKGEQSYIGKGKNKFAKGI